MAGQPLGGPDSRQSFLLCSEEILPPPQMGFKALFLRSQQRVLLFCTMNGASGRLGASWLEEPTGAWLLRAGCHRPALKSALFKSLQRKGGAGIGYGTVAQLGSPPGRKALERNGPERFSQPGQKIPLFGPWFPANKRRGKGWYLQVDSLLTWRFSVCTSVWQEASCHPLQALCPARGKKTAFGRELAAHNGSGKKAYKSRGNNNASQPEGKNNHRLCYQGRKLPQEHQKNPTLPVIYIFFRSKSRETSLRAVVFSRASSHIAKGLRLIRPGPGFGIWLPLPIPQAWAALPG